MIMIIRPCVLVAALICLFSGAAMAGESLLITEVPLIDEGGVNKINLMINGRRERGLLDTGATEMYVPADLVSSWIDFGLASKKDMLPSKIYVLADGSLKNCERITISEIIIGSSVFHDIRAMIGASGSQLLIGQSLLKKTNYYVVDNERGVLEFGVSRQGK